LARCFPPPPCLSSPCLPPSVPDSSGRVLLSSGGRQVGGWRKISVYQTQSQPLLGSVPSRNSPCSVQKVEETPYPSRCHLADTSIFQKSERSPDLCSRSPPKKKKFHLLQLTAPLHRSHSLRRENRARFAPLQIFVRTLVLRTKDQLLELLLSSFRSPVKDTSPRRNSTSPSTTHIGRKNGGPPLT